MFDINQILQFKIESNVILIFITLAGFYINDATEIRRIEFGSLE